MATTTRTVIVIPTSINVLCAVNEGIVRNRKRGLDGEIVLPSLRRRARMIVKEDGVLPMREEVVEDTDFFTR